MASGPQSPAGPPRVVVLVPKGGTDLTRRLALPAKIGRRVNARMAPSENNGIFDSKVLSRSHAELYYENGRVYLKDLGSSNGTFVNGAAVKGTQALEDGDTIDFGVDVTEEDGDVHRRVTVQFSILPVDSSGALAEALPEVDDYRSTSTRPTSHARDDAFTSSKMLTPKSVLESLLHSLQSQLAQQHQVQQELLEAKAALDRRTNGGVSSPGAGVALAAATAEATRLRDEQAQLRNELVVTQARLATAETMQVDLAKKLAAAEAEQAGLQDEAAALRIRADAADAAECRSEELAAQVTSLQATVASHEERERRAQAELAAVRKQLEESQQATASAQAQHEAAAKALEAERARAADLQAELEQQAKRSATELDKLKSRLATADTALSENRHLVAELQKALDEAANKARRQQQDVAAELNKMQKQLSAVQATLEEERKAHEAARALAKAEHQRELEARDAELRSLETECQRLRKRDLLSPRGLLLVSIVGALALYAGRFLPPGLL